MNEKLCTTCNTLKSIDYFSTGNSGTYTLKAKSIKNRCNACCAEYARKWRKKNKGYTGSGKLKAIPTEDKLLMSAISSRLGDAKGRIKRSKQTPTDLDADYLYELFKKQKGLCALSDVHMKLETNVITTLSLDKIDPSLGYVKGNVQWLCWAVNRAKGEMHTTTFKDMCKKITEKCNDYPEKEYS